MGRPRVMCKVKLSDTCFGNSVYEPKDQKSLIKEKQTYKHLVKVYGSWSRFETKQENHTLHHPSNWRTKLERFFILGSSSGCMNICVHTGTVVNVDCGGGQPGDARCSPVLRGWLPAPRLPPPPRRRPQCRRRRRGGGEGW